MNCNLHDGGISPKNVCQGCLDKLQIVHEFKWKSHESDKYLKQILSHSGLVPAEEPDITPYNPPDLNSSLYEHADDENGDDEDDENSLLTPMEPMDFDYTEQISNAVEQGLELKKGQRHGEFHCRICNKYFKYVKPYKNHLKLHKSTPKKISYYKRKKLLMAQANQQTSTPKSAPLKIVKTLSKRSEPQAQYDSLSPYNSPAPYEKESVALHNNRDSSPDFGEFMLNTSRHLLNGDDDYVEQQAGTSNNRPKGRTWKKDGDDDRDYNPNFRQKRAVKPSILKKPGPASVVAPVEAIIPDLETPPLEKRRVRFPAKSTKEVEEDEPPPKRPGPLSKTRLKAKTTEDKVMIEGFSEVDITKMLKKPRKDDSSRYGKLGMVRILSGLLEA